MSKGIKDRKEYTPKIKETVRVVRSYTGSQPSGRVGIVKSVDNTSKGQEVWVDFPDGSGGIYLEVLPHAKVDWNKLRSILIEYKAGEIELESAFSELERFIFYNL